MTIRSTARRGPALRRARGFGRLRGAPRSGSTLRLPIPVEILRRVEFGLDRGEAGRDVAGWWRRVEQRMHRFVYSRLPPGARQVELCLDDERWEVVARFRLPRPVVDDGEG